MWISKKKYEELIKRINTIEEKLLSLLLMVQNGSTTVVMI